MAAKFLITKGNNSKSYFVLKAKNGQTILQSQGYSSKSGCQNGIESVIKNSSKDSCWEKKTAKDGRFYFALNSTNGQQIGRSQMYKSESGRNNRIASVKENAPSAVVVEA